MLKKTMKVFTTLGLFEQCQGQIELNSSLPEPARDPSQGEALLHRTIRRLLFQPEHNDDLWESDKDGRDLVRALSFVLALDIDAVPLQWTARDGGYKRSMEIVQSSMVEEGRKIFQNNTRWDAFRFWAPFLGFAWHSALLPGASKSTHSVLVIDPTRALREEMPELLAVASRGSDQPIAIARVREVIMERLPVLEAGRYQRVVQPHLLASHWRAPARGVLSSALAHGLKRLQEEGAIELLSWSDAEQWQFPVSRNRDVESYSHLRVGKAMRAQEEKGNV